MKSVMTYFRLAVKLVSGLIFVNGTKILILCMHTDASCQDFAWDY